MRSKNAPPVPDSLPKYLAKGLPKQDQETLEDIREFVDALLEQKATLADEPINEDELPEDADIVEEGPKGTVYLEYRTCGDESCRCMSGGEKHGPYKYRVYRDGNTVRRDYLGTAAAEE